MGQVYGSVAYVVGVWLYTCDICGTGVWMWEMYIGHLWDPVWQVYDCIPVTSVGHMYGCVACVVGI